MLKKIISLVTLICFISYLYGCSSIEVIQLSNNSNFEDVKDSDIVSTVTKDNKIYEFETNGIKPKPQIAESVLVGWAKGPEYKNEYRIKEVQIPISDIKALQVEVTDETKTLLLIGGVIGVLAAIVFLSFNNMNFGLGDVKWDPMGRH